MLGWGLWWPFRRAAVWAESPSPARMLLAARAAAVMVFVVVFEIDDVELGVVAEAAVRPADMARLDRICWWLERMGLGRICRWIWAAFGFSLASSAGFMLARDWRIVLVEVMREGDVDNGTMVTELLMWLNWAKRLLWWSLLVLLAEALFCERRRLLSLVEALALWRELCMGVTDAGRMSTSGGGVGGRGPTEADRTLDRL